MNQKTKASIESHIVEDQNDIWVLGMCPFVSEEFDNDDYMLIALYHGKIRLVNKGNKIYNNKSYTICYVVKI